MTHIDPASGYGIYHICNSCSSSSRGPTVQVTGKCSTCPRNTNHRRFKYCVVCAKKKNICNVCGARNMTNLKRVVDKLKKTDINSCKACKGTGGKPRNKCKSCDGTGQVGPKPL